MLAAFLLPALLLAGLAKALADATAHGSPRLASRGPWWRAETSWQNKYADYAAGDLRPAFWGSTTFLVFATDSWHFANFVGWCCWALACLLACWLGWAAVWWLAAGLVLNKLAFEPAYRYLRA